MRPRPLIVAGLGRCGTTLAMAGCVVPRSVACLPYLLERSLVA